MSSSTRTPRSSRRRQINFESVAEAASVAIFVVHAQRILYANPAASIMTGYSSEELSALEFWQIAHPSYQAILKRLGDTPAWSKDVPSRYELKVLTKSGEERWLDLTMSPIEFDGQSAIAITAFDITERDRAERALRAAQRELEARVQARTAELAAANEHLNSVLGSITEAYVAFDTEWRFRTINAAAERDIFGRPANELLGKVIWHEYPQTIGQEVHRHYQQAVKTGQPVHFEVLSSIRPGRWFEVHAYPHRQGLEAYFRDITERKQAEAEIANLARFPAENPNPVLRLDGTGEILYANDPGRNLLGNWARTTGDVTLTYWRNLAIDALTQKARVTVDVACAGRTYLIFANPIVHAGYANLYAQDITERKRAEEALALSNQKLAQVLDSIQDDFYVLDHDWKFVYVSRQFTGRIGLEPQDFIGNCIWEMFPKHIGSILEQNFRASMEKREVRRFEVGGKYTTAYYSMTSFPSAEGITVLGTDITARKRAEEALRESETKYRIVSDHTYDWEFWLAPDDHFLYCSPACERLTGHTAEEFLADPSLRARLIHPADRGKFEAHLNEVEHAQAIGEGEWRFIRPDGTYRWIGHVCQPMFDETGQFLGVRGSNRDITERKRAEQQIFEANQRLAAMMNALPVGVSFSDDTSCQRITGNPLTAQQFEVGQDDNLSASAPDSSQPGRQIQYYRDGRPLSDTDLPLQRAVAENREIPPMELEVCLPSGRRWFCSASSAPIHDQQGNVIGSVAVTVDITARKHAEEALRTAKAVAENERLRLEAVLQALPVAMAITNAQGGNVQSNRAFEQLWGKERPPVNDVADYTAYKARWSDTGRPVQADEWASVQAVKTGEPVLGQMIELERFDGTRRHVINNAAPVRDTAGAVVGAAVAVVDITDLRQAEQALRESQALLQAVLDNTPDAIFLKDRAGHLLLANPATLAIVGKPAEAVIGKTDAEIYDDVAAAQAIMANDQRIMQSGQLEIVEERVQGAQETRVYLSTKAPYRDSAGRVVGLIGVGHDITKRKQAEEALRESQATLQSFYDSAPFMMGITEVCNDQSVLISGNRALGDFFKTQSPNIFGHRSTELGTPQNIEQLWVENYRKSQAQGSSVQFELEYPQPGAGRWFRATVSFINIGSSGNPRFSFVAEDITERKQAEEQVRLHARELAVVNADLARFNRAAVGRELRMIELKKQINALCLANGQPPRYPLDFEKDEV